MVAHGLLTGPKGDKGDSGLAPGFTGPNGMVNNDNGKTTAVVGGAPIVSYVPASSSGNFTGGSVAGFTDLSAHSLMTSAATVSGNLTVQGNSTFSGGTFTGLLTAGTSTHGDRW
jgi:hypothetical protein